MKLWRPRLPRHTAPLAALSVAVVAIPVVAVGSTVYFLGYNALRAVFRRR